MKRETSQLRHLRGSDCHVLMTLPLVARIFYHLDPVRSMEEGTKSKKTVFVGGVAEEVDETKIYEAFSTFGTFSCYN